MLDDIGLGAAIANAVYAILFVIAIVGSLIALLFHKKLFSLVWFLVVLNVFLILYSLGMLGMLGVLLRFSTMIILPIINIVLIIYYLKQKPIKK